MTKEKTNTEKTLTEFDKQPTIKFTIEKQLHNSINYRDLSLHHRGKKFEFAIYRKPTQTDIVIPTVMTPAIPTNTKYQVSTA